MQIDFWEIVNQALSFFLDFWLVWIILLAGIVFVLVFRGFFRKKERLPYKKKQFLLNISERKVFEFLSAALPNDYVIFPQIGLKSIIRTTARGRDFRSYQNRIDKKIVDFVIFEKTNLVPVLAIEYDGPTHGRADRKERDKFVDDALESAGMKIIHIKHERSLNLEKIGSEVVESLKNN